MHSSSLLLRAAFLLGLGALAACASAPARTEAPAPAAAPSLKNCYELPAAEGFSFQCGAVDGFVHDIQAPADEALRAFTEKLKQHYEDQGELETQALDEGADRVPGRSTLRLRIQWKERPEQPVAEGYLFGFERAGGTRVASCLASDGGRAPWELCHALLRTEPAVPDFSELLGRPVPIPEGCGTKFDRLRLGAYAVTCPDARLMWHRVNAPPDTTMPERLTRGLGSGPGKVLEDTDVTCQLRGHPGTCRRLVKETSEGVQRVLVGVTSEARHSVVVNCSWTKQEDLPAMCADIFTVE